MTMNRAVTSQMLVEHGYATAPFPRDSVLESLTAARAFMGKTGTLASLPDMLRWQFPVQKDEEFTTNSQEYLLLTPQGRKVVMILHGDGPLSDPARLEKATYERMDKGEGIHLTDMEARELLEGKIHGKQTFPVYSYNDFCTTPCGVPFEAQHYAIILGLKRAKESPIGQVHYTQLCSDPLFILRCGRPEFALRYLYLMRTEFVAPHDLTTDSAFFDGNDQGGDRLSGEDIKSMNAGAKQPLYNESFQVWHPYNNADANVFQGHIIFHGGSERGLSSGHTPLHEGHYRCIYKQTDDDPGVWRPSPSDDLQHLLRHAGGTHGSK